MMKRIASVPTKAVSLAAGLFFILAVLQPLSAQVSEYQRLAFQKEQPAIYLDVLPLPGDDGTSLQLTTIFRISNNFLPFRKLDDSSRNDEFFSTSKLNIEVFKSPRKGLKPDKQIDVEGLQSVGRSTWSDTAYAATYERTQSNTLGLNGAMQVQVQPGNYTYLMQLNQDQSKNTRNSRTRNIHLSPYNKQKSGNIILGSKIDNPENPSQINLINRGNNVIYGEDFYALIHIPNYEEGAGYQLQIDRVERSKDDTTQIGQVLNQKITTADIHQNIQPKLANNGDELSLDLKSNKNAGHTYALLRIPNKKFPNSTYRLQVTAEGASQPTASGIFQSYWSDIPTSLLSLDVAIDMLRFITDDETIDKIDDGSDRERERKFREFWKQKDPTPDTEFNELQAEYYSRIDYTYENFGSQNTLGFNTDRGRIYINYGPPNDTKRTFPTDGATTEVWTYDNRKFVFKATSGFGDFKLVSK